MSTINEINLVQARRWNRGSWLALSFALFLFTNNAILAVRTLQVPADGWLWSSDYQAIGPEIIFDFHIIGPPSPIQVSDKLISIEGQSTVELVGKQFFWRRSPTPDWPDGTVLTYFVERKGLIVSLAVPVYRYSFGELFIAGIRLQGLPGLVQIAGSTFFFVVGVIVFLLRPRQRAAHALLILGTAFLFNAVPFYGWTTSFFYSFRPASVPFDTWTLAINPSLMLLALAFPIPKWPIRRFPHLTTLFLYLWAPLVIDSAYLLNLDNPAGYFKAANVVYVVQILMLFILVFGTLIQSAFKVHERVARNQLKWVGLGLASFVLPGIGGWFVGFILGFQSEIIYLISVAGWFIMPVCLAIAITRYRLFDIDIIIRRTLQYTVLTVLLGLVYFGSIFVLQALVGQAVDDQSPLIIVFSTLLIAVLFNPLRGRIQNVIDGRFFRKKYDAQHILAQFAQTTRDEVEMDKLTAALLTVVQGTLQPEKIDLWLKPEERK